MVDSVVPNAAPAKKRGLLKKILLGVGMGSSRPPRLVRLDYAPAGATAHVALVGKGITFDSGGLSIKTAAGMMTMKVDMSGGAAVLAAMSVLGAVGAPVAVDGWIPLTDNMTGGNAQRPGDVFRARNGKTVEVLNTDAEGRLVLADALALAVEWGPEWASGWSSRHKSKTVSGCGRRELMYSSVRRTRETPLSGRGPGWSLLAPLNRK